MDGVSLLKRGLSFSGSDGVGFGVVLALMVEGVARSALGLKKDRSVDCCFGVHERDRRLPDFGGVRFIVFLCLFLESRNAFT